MRYIRELADELSHRRRSAAQHAPAQEPDQLYAAMSQVDSEARKLADGLELVLSMARLNVATLRAYTRALAEPHAA